MPPDGDFPNNKKISDKLSAIMDSIRALTLSFRFFGPSSGRDTTGLVVDSAARFFYLFKPLGLDDPVWRGTAYTLTNSIDTRHQLKFRYYQTGSPFEYDLIRLLYKKMRELEIEK